jgi:hypothetical protein
MCLAHLCPIPEFILAMRADPNRIHSGRREHPNVLLTHSLTTVCALTHTYRISELRNIITVSQIGYRGVPHYGVQPEK